MNNDGRRGRVMTRVTHTHTHSRPHHTGGASLIRLERRARRRLVRGGRVRIERGAGALLLQRGQRQRLRGGAAARQLRVRLVAAVFLFGACEGLEKENTRLK